MAESNVFDGFTTTYSVQRAYKIWENKRNYQSGFGDKLSGGEYGPNLSGFKFSKYGLCLAREVRPRGPKVGAVKFFSFKAHSFVKSERGGLTDN